MHMKRWLTGIIAAPFLIYMIWVGPRWLFYLFLFVAAIIALAEFYWMAPSRLPKVVQWFSYFIALLLFRYICRKAGLAYSGNNCAVGNCPHDLLYADPPGAR